MKLEHCFINLLKFTLSAFLTFVFVLSVNAQLKKDLHTYIDVIRSKKGFSGEILVAKGENVIFRESVGLASVEHDLKLENGDKYRIASITKTFTGTLIAIAQAENKLNVEDKAGQYIEGLSDKFKDITIYQLLTHTSGLPHNEGIKDYWQVKSKLQLENEQVISEINDLDLLFPPGSKMSYSSLGYYLLADILEKVYQDDFQNILENKILKKLEMNETGAADTLKVIPRMTAGYHLVTDDRLVVAPYRNYSMLKGAGDMYSSSTDLLKWSNSFFSGNLLNEKTKALMFTAKNSVEKNYGYGWFIKNEKPKKYYHGGGTWGYSSYIALYPEEKISIIVLSNVSTLPTESIAADIEKMVFGLPFEMPEKEKEILPDSIDLKIYSGNFISDSGKMKLNIIYTKNNLFAQLVGNPPFEIYPKGDHRFFGKKVELEITFEVKDDVVSGLNVERTGQIFHFKKL
ncbi:serine hydrolase domain-containing protein [soil metagenome]